MTEYQQKPSPPGRPLLLFLLFAVGCALRFWNLGIHSFWHDEGATLYLATAPDSIEALRGSRHPPVAIFLFRFWISIFGEGDAAVRALPALLSSASFAIFVILAKRWCVGWAAALAVAIYAFAPFQVWYAGEVTPYAFFEFGSLVTLFGLSAPLGGSAKWYHYALLTFGLAFAFGSQYMSCVLGVTVVACAAFATIQKNITWTRAAVAITAAAAGGLAWLPWILTIFREQLKTPWGDEAKLKPRELAELPTRLLLIDMSVLHGTLQIIGYALGGIIYIGLLLFIIKLAKRRRVEDFYIFLAMTTPFLGAFGLLLLSWNFLPRYLTAAAPAVACAVAVGIAYLSEFKFSRLAAPFLGILMIGGLAFVTILQKIDNRREDYRSGCEEILDKWRPGDHVFVVTGTPDPFAEAPARHYLRSRPEIVGSIEHVSLTIQKIGDLYRPGTRLHVLYRERAYSQNDKIQFDRAARLVDQSSDRLGIRRLCYEVPER